MIADNYLYFEANNTFKSLDLFASNYVMLSDKKSF